MTSPEDQRIINEALKARGIKVNRSEVNIPVPQQDNSPVTVVSPTSGVLPVINLKSFDNWRAALHGAVPAIITALTALHLTTQDQASVWAALAIAIIDPLLSVANSTDKLRRIAYSVMGLLSSAGFVATLLIGYESWVPIVSAIVTIINAFLGRFYTPTTTMVPKAVP